jgi:hypothetical protein
MLTQTGISRNKLTLHFKIIGAPKKSHETVPLNVYKHGFSISLKRGGFTSAQRSCYSLVMQLKGFGYIACISQYRRMGGLYDYLPSRRLEKGDGGVSTFVFTSRIKRFPIRMNSRTKTKTQILLYVIK